MVRKQQFVNMETSRKVNTPNPVNSNSSKSLSVKKLSASIGKGNKENTPRTMHSAQLTRAPVTSALFTKLERFVSQKKNETPELQAKRKVKLTPSPNETRTPLRNNLLSAKAATEGKHKAAPWMDVTERLYKNTPRPRNVKKPLVTAEDIARAIGVDKLVHTCECLFESTDLDAFKAHLDQHKHVGKFDTPMNLRVLQEFKKELKSLPHGGIKFAPRKCKKLDFNMRKLVLDDKNGQWSAE